MVSHRDRIRSIHTPPRRDRVAPSKREPMPDVGPTEFQLQRQAETIGAGTVCDLKTKKVEMVREIAAGQGSVTIYSKQVQADAELASSSALGRLFIEELIRHDQYRAGTEYARLHRLLYGAVTPKQSALAKAIASSLEQRLEEANRAAREERDDEDYADWLIEQRTLYDRGEYALSRIMVDLDRGWQKAKASHRFAKAGTIRVQVRAVLRSVCLDNTYPRRTLVGNLKIGLQALCDCWRIE